jgi:putative glutathione S-transferase
LLELYQVAGLRNGEPPQIKRHYYASHPMINPTRIVPKGPAIDFNMPHNRARISG